MDIKTRTVNTVQFESYDISLDVARAIKGMKESPKHRLEMSLSEMRQYLHQNADKNIIYYRTLMDYYKKFSVPIACISLGLLSLALGFQSNIKKRSNGVILALTFFMLYYIVLSAGWGYGETGKYPPIVGMWLPNLIFGLLAVFLLSQTGKGRSNFIIYCVEKVKRPFKFFKRS